jgi:hypothetical protein
MKSDILREEGIVNRIINDLSVYSNIPNSGFLAGGSVANLLMKYVWEDKYPINDLDIFVESDRSERIKFSSTPVRSNQLIIEGDGYMVTKMVYDKGTTYNILDVKRDGMLNTIVISKLWDREKSNDYTYILNGFDFNCCQVGIDLKNNKLYYTDGFESFLNYRQLEITAVYTPAHTAIRLFKKLDELKCYCNVEECMELISQPLILENMINFKVNQFGIYFSTKYKEMYLQYYSKLKNYFHMVKFFDHKKELWNIRNRQENSIPETHSLSWLDPNRSIPKNYLEKWAKYNGIMWTLVPKKYNTPNKTIETILIGVGYNPLTFMSAYNLVSNKINKKLKDKAKKVILGKYWLCKMVSLVDYKFYDCDFDEKHVDYIENFIDKERWAFATMVSEGMNIQESYEFIKTLNKIINKEGEWVSELIIKYLETKNKVIKPTYENIMLGLNKEKEKYSVNLITPLNIDSFQIPSGVKVKELTSELDLKWAGRRLNNCMNNPSQNYAEKIRSGKTKLFVIITENNMSGLELQLIEETVYKNVQLLSYCNKVTSEYHTTIANLLINYLNVQHLKEIYLSKVESYMSIDLFNRSLLINLKDEKTDNNRVGHMMFPIPMDEAFNNIVIDNQLDDEDTFDWDWDDNRA